LGHIPLPFDEHGIATRDPNPIALAAAATAAEVEPRQGAAAERRRA
jgi:hypothetical protein